EKRDMKKSIYILFFILSAIFAFQSFPVNAENRFPKPEFEQGHIQPETITPSPRLLLLEYLDVAVLITALSLISYFILKKRSRKLVFWTSVFSVLYFGFYREGCVCSIGAIQNVTLALFKDDYHIPLTAFLFFIIPLIYTLLFGRTFCAGICPLGALQDIVGLKPMPIEAWLEKVLGIFPFIYLGLAVLFAATGTDFVICRYDPFVGFFRLDASFTMFMIGGLFLIAGVFIARPYCRFLCPYGALLNIISRFSFKHMTITPETCINCRLCENACPYGAINMPVQLKEKEKTETVVRRYILLSIMVPIFIFTGGFLASNFSSGFAHVNPKVKLAKELKNNTNYGMGEKEALEITAFRSSGQSMDELNLEVAKIEKEFYLGSWILGGFTGLVFGLMLISLTVFKYHPDYSPNKATCHSCARCMEFCPVKPGVL
ncbi:MAG TPA: 4Fe-4S binding protein, partial [Saprospiraceae bacterium]|nr:4Fe-4S binding protein [Saprospiraceae bacterium]